MGEIYKKLNVVYYSIYTLVILLTIGGYFLNMNNIVDFSKEARLSYLPHIVTGISIASIVFGFGLFQFQKGKLSLIEDKRNRYNRYFKLAALRLYSTGIVFLLGVPVFYITKNITLLTFVGIAAIILIYSKPTLNKISRDLGEDER